jgi:hypothetical protein
VRKPYIGPETGYITLIAAAFGLVDTIVGAAAGTAEAEAEKAKADAAAAQAQLDAERLRAQTVAAESWVPGVPNWALLAAGGVAAFFLLDL